MDKQIAINSCVSLVAVLGCLFFLEISVRGYDVIIAAFEEDKPKKPETPPLHITVKSAVLYALNPAHPEINSHGLRDDEIPFEKPKGTTRILVLGDSIAYGAAVARDNTFPNRIESALRKTLGPTDVINSGVQGYTTYSELQYYLGEGRNYDADIVLLAFCMNDVVNPRRHWDYTGESIKNIPEEAIPNPDYDRRLAEIHSRRKNSPNSETPFSRFFANHSALYRMISRRVRRLMREEHRRKGKVPTYITGEDSKSIEVLIDRSSAEWRWLTSTLTKLKHAVAADGKKFGIVIFPLAYQLDTDYPYFPQKNFSHFCKLQAIPCLDLLPSFKKYDKNEIFLLDRPGFHDIWHLTNFGHELAAAEISGFLRQHRLLPNKN